MANQSKLKAWVRYDGTGRVISGGPIFQVNKPKVGNWKQIDANLCCNGALTTTTTTTAGGGVTPTAWVGYLSTSTYNSCNEIGGSTTVLYTSTPTIEIGTFFYVDAALTQVYPGTLSPFKIGTSAYSIYGFGQGPLIGSVSYIWNCNNFPITTSTTTTTAAPSYTIGEAALGGVIAYINGGGSTGTSGLVATAADISTGAEWGCIGTEITGADGTAIGAGNQNTIDIMAGCATAGIAARLCGDLVEGGYSDWYLPSKDELNALYLNRVAIGGFSSVDQYWSSTEYDANLAWKQNFSNSAQGFTGKVNPFYVRAIRSF